MKIKREYIIDKNRFRYLSGIIVTMEGTRYAERNVFNKEGFRSKDEISIPINKENNQRFKVKIEIESIPDPSDQRPLERPDGEEDGD